MLLHASQTSAGISPRRFRNTKIIQPRQKPAKASSEAATTRSPRTVHAAGAAPAKNKTRAVVETNAPMPCAKRLGGPGTSFTFPSRGVMTFTGRRASGEIRGPNSTRSQKPAAMASSPHPEPVAAVA